MKLHDFLYGTSFTIKHATYYVKVGEFGFNAAETEIKSVISFVLMKIAAEKIIRQIKVVRKIKRRNFRFPVKVDFSQIFIEF